MKKGVSWCLCQMKSPCLSLKTTGGLRPFPAWILAFWCPLQEFIQFIQSFIFQILPILTKSSSHLDFLLLTQNLNIVAFRWPRFCVFPFIYPQKSHQSKKEYTLKSSQKPFLHFTRPWRKEYKKVTTILKWFSILLIDGHCIRWKLK